MEKIQEIKPSALLKEKALSSNGFKNMFPFRSILNLDPLIEYWEDCAKGPNKMNALLAQQVLDLLKEAPELRGPIEDLSILDDHQDLIECMMSALFPQGTLDDEVMGASVPYDFQQVYASEKFKKLFSAEAMVKNIDKEHLDKMRSREAQAIYAYAEILDKFYQFPVAYTKPMVFSMEDPDTKLEQYYKVQFYNKYLRIVKRGKLPKLSLETLNLLNENVGDLELWKKHLPPHHFEFQGIALLRFTDVSDEELSALLKYRLLQKDALTDSGKFKDIERDMASFLGIGSLTLGVSAFDREKSAISKIGNNIHHSFVLSYQSQEPCTKSTDSLYHKLMKTKSQVIVDNLEDLPSFTSIEKGMREDGYRSVYLAPITRDNEPIGVLEIAAKEEGVFSHSIDLQIQQLIPMFSVAIQKESEEFDNRVQNLIKEECTALHPAVEWRFADAAEKVLNSNELDAVKRMETIVFEDVYPLYAASDIRGSSVRRNQAIQTDLIDTMQLVAEVLHKVANGNPMPILDNLQFRIDQRIQYIHEGLGSGDELAVVEFLREEISPLFEHFSRQSKEFKELVDKFFEAIEPKLGLVYRKRKDFEESLTHINDAVSAYLDKKEEAAQKMFPHYFEKFKTDGVEYNIYVGQSLQQEKNFAPIYLKNLRLWQLQTTVEIAKITADMRDQLTVPLETTHLILVHGTPLSIRFRTEEKHFDVDGAYNIRYEIIKKRIDKSLIKNTDERLTQPGKIAIVYSSDHDAREYMEYIRYLQAEGFLAEEVEEVELEDLQGVKGLRALRVKVI